MLHGILGEVDDAFHWLNRALDERWGLVIFFKSLPDSAIADLRKEGYDARSFWEALKKTGPAEILTVEGKDGERIQVWLE